MFKPLRSLLLALLTIAVVLAACAPAAPQPTSLPVAPTSAATTAPTAAEPLDVAFVLPGAINDGSFNTQAYNAILAVQEALGITTTFVEGLPAPADGAKAIRDYAAEGHDVVAGHGGQYANSVLEIAPDFPDTTFIALAGPGLTLPPNVWIAGSEFESTYFLAGALAGYTTKSNKVGFIGGGEIPIYKAGALAFEAGAKHVNPNVEVLSVFTGDFNDATKAREAAVGQIENGVDVIQHSLNLGAFGVFEAARQAGGVKVIGLAVDQKSLAPDVVLSTVILNYAKVYERILTEVAAGKKGGYMPMSLAGGTSYLAPFYGEVPEDIEGKLDALEQQLINGEIDVPTQADLQ